MSAVKIEGNASGTGALTIAAPNTNTNRTLTLPDNTGTLVSTGSVGVVTPAMTQVGALPSMVRLNTGNGQGSTNTAIHRFTTTVTNQGSDITYADSATLGGSFTINTNGIYAISFSGAGSVATYQGISLNSTQLTTGINSLTNASEVLAVAYSSGANNSVSPNWTGYLPATSIIRAQGTVSASLSTPAAQFTITRVA